MSTISTSVTLDSSNIGSYTFPITVNGGSSGNPTVITLGSDLIFTANNYFNFSSDYITFNGNGYNIYYDNVSAMYGLASYQTFNNLLIQKVGIILTGSTTIGGNAAALVFISTGNNNNIDECFVYFPSGSTPGNGSLFGAYNCKLNISNSYGIVGSLGTNSGVFGGYQFTGDITNCYCNKTTLVGISYTGTISNSYGYSGTWDSSTANSNLTGTPTYSSSTYTDGSIWSNIDPTSSTIPYVLKVFNVSQYSPNSQTIHTGSINTSDNSTFTGTHSLVAVKQGTNDYTTTNTHISIDSSTGQLTFDSTIDVDTYAIKTYTVNSNGGYSINDYSLTVLTVCFLKGTKILALINGEETYISVEELEIGMELKTYLHGYKKITHKTNFHFNNGIPNNFYRIFFSKNYGFGGTGNHSLLVDSFEKSHNKIDDKDLKLFQYDENFELIDDSNIYELYHFVLETDNNYVQYGVYANGILCETMSEAYYEKPY